MKLRGILLGFCLMLFMSITVLGSTVASDEDNEIHRTVMSINDIRRDLGIKTLLISDKLNEIAKYHSKYMHFNNELTSIEKSDLFYFRGRYPWDRADYFEYEKSFIYEFVGKDYSNYIDYHNALLNDPISRTILLNPMYVDIGMSYFDRYYTIEYGGNKSTFKRSVIYPYDGQENVTRSWSGETLELINKDDNNISVEAVGTPITYTYYGEDISKITNKRFKIIDTLTNESIAYKLIEPGVYHQLENTLMLLPLNTYNYDRIYEVYMQFDVELEDGSVVSVDEVVVFKTIGYNNKINESRYVTRENFTEKVINNPFLSFALIEPLEIKFSDVDIKSKNSIYINTASELNIINGYPDGRFGPGLNITKEQAYKIMIDAFEKQVRDINPEENILDQYKDQDEISSWAYKNVEKAATIGIVISEGGYMNPESYLREDELTRIINKYNQKLYSIIN